MTRAAVLICCGYVLLALQLVLPGEAGRVAGAAVLPTGGAIAWLLLPWLAAFPHRTGGILLAAAYGLAIDCTGGLHPGLLLGLTVSLTAMLQNLPWPVLLKTAPRIAACSFICALLPAMAVTTVSVALHPGVVDPPSLVIHLLVLSAGGAAAASLIVSVCRGVVLRKSYAVAESR